MRPVRLKRETTPVPDGEYRTDTGTVRVKDGKLIDTLQKGDWFTGTPLQYRAAFDRCYPSMSVNTKKAFTEIATREDHVYFDGREMEVDEIGSDSLVRRLSPEQFALLAENTFPGPEGFKATHVVFEYPVAAIQKHAVEKCSLGVALFLAAAAVVISACGIIAWLLSIFK